MSETASIVLTKSTGFRAEVRLSKIPDAPALLDSDCRLVADLVDLVSGLLYPGIGDADLAAIRRQVDDRVSRTATPIRVEFEAGWVRERVGGAIDGGRL